MKKYFCILLCLIILFAFTACANKNSETHCYNCNKIIFIEDTYCKYCGTKTVDNTNENNKATASVMITVNNDNDTSINNSDIVTLKQLGYTYIDIIQAQMQKIQEKLDFYISISELKESIHFDFQSENSNIINITVFADTKEKADKILSCILNESPEFTKNTFPNAKFTVVSID